MFDIFTDISWAYLQILDAGKIPLVLLAIGIFGMMVLARLIQHRRLMTWLVLLNYGIVIQFVAILTAWLLVAVYFEREFYYFVSNFFLLTWPSLPFILMACFVPLFAGKKPLRDQRRHQKEEYLAKS